MVEVNNRTRSRIDPGIIKEITEKFLTIKRLKQKDVSIALVGDRVVRKLNKRYRGIDRITDVLAFPGEKEFLGEIIIDYAQIRRQAPKYSRSVKDELIFILIHGLLHLCGETDDTEAKRKRMIEKGEQIMAKIIS